MNFAIWGAGAVGLGLATTLARSDSPITILGRDEATLDSIRRDGISRLGLFGEHHVPADQIRATRELAELVESEPDWILVCTKAFAAADVARQLAPYRSALVDKTRLLLCQNGWGNEIPFRSFWPDDRLFHARVITGFHRRDLRQVEVTAHAAPIAMGNVLGESSQATAAIAAAISAGGIPAERNDDMRGVLWAKMLYNCALNPLGALAGRRYGELTEDPNTRPIVDAVIREIFGVLEAAGITVPWHDVEAYLDTFHGELIPPTAQHESSMLQDLRAGRPTEIEALCGAVEALAETKSVETPIVSALAELVRAAETRASGRAD